MQFTLVNQVHRLNCMYRIWRERSFRCSDGLKPPIPLPLPAQSALRHIAKRAMESLELDILNELDNCFVPKNAVTKQESLAVWVSLWQLIFIYVDLLDWKNSGLAVDASREQFEQCRRVTMRLLQAVAVFYAGHFRSKSKLEQVDQHIDAIFEQKHWIPIQMHLKQAFDWRDEYCEFEVSPHALSFANGKQFKSSRIKTTKYRTCSRHWSLTMR